MKLPTADFITQAPMPSRLSLALEDRSGGRKEWLGMSPPALPLLWCGLSVTAFLYLRPQLLSHSLTWTVIVLVRRCSNSFSFLSVLVC